MTTQTDVFMHSRNGAITEQEYYDLHDQLDVAEKRGDEAEYDRIFRLIPITANVAKAAKDVFSKEFLVSAGFDITEADIEFGRWMAR